MTKTSDIDVESLPPAIDTATAAALLGMSRGALWAAARDGDAPVQPIRVGRALRWPTAPLLRLLGLGGSSSAVTLRSDGSAEKRPYEDHPAYGVLVDAFRRSTRSPHHLAFLALQALDGKFAVVPAGSPLQGQDE